MRGCSYGAFVFLINFKVWAKDVNLRNSQHFKDENQTELYVNIQFVPHSKHTKLLWCKCDCASYTPSKEDVPTWCKQFYYDFFS